MGKCIRVKR
uniref:Uncharacterized protein n=1 Tax=Anguilla anguilla TaxID=7936 RepID=A0A0E9XP24_ANGAN